MMLYQGDELDDIALKIKNVFVIPEFMGYADAIVPLRFLESIVVLKGDKRYSILMNRYRYL